MIFGFWRWLGKNWPVFNCTGTDFWKQSNHVAEFFQICNTIQPNFQICDKIWQTFASFAGISRSSSILARHFANVDVGAVQKCANLQNILDLEKNAGKCLFAHKNRLRFSRERANPEFDKFGNFWHRCKICQRLQKTLAGVCKKRAHHGSSTGSRRGCTINEVPSRARLGLRAVQRSVPHDVLTPVQMKPEPLFLARSTHAERGRQI